MSYTSWYPGLAGGLATLQRSLIAIEGAATTQRSYSPDIVTGLLQIPAYAHAILSACVSVLEVVDDTEATVKARIERQAVLDDESKRFHLLIGETALLRTVGNRRVMTAQLRTLLDTVTARHNVDVGIIPTCAEFVVPATDFTITDDARVDSETVTGTVTATTAEDIALAARTFDQLTTQAVYGEDARAILHRAIASHATR
ncbi:DUF5753 domain-containing protein [Nocardia thailandica]